MAMGGLMKAQHHGHGSSNRGKPYGLMLLMAFGAAMIGVMALHKFRERRVFNLLVKEKDRELTSLQLLLQKERDHAREAKWKLEEMKTKVNTLRTQKGGLDSRIVEMQSTISSLREEQKTIELTLEEKQNEIKLMRERQAWISNSNPQVKALSEMLRHRESEEGLQNRLETSVKVWSVSTDDPSNASIDQKTKTSLTERDQTNVSEGKQASGDLSELTNPKVADNSTEHAYSGRSETAKYEIEEQTAQGEDRGENGKVSVESTEEIREYTRKVDDPKESVSEHGSTNFGDKTNEDEGKNIDNSQSGEAIDMQENNNIAKIEAVENHDGEAQRSRDQINAEDEVLQTKGHGLQGRTSNAQGAENQESGIRYKGGMKLEMPDSPQIGQYRLEGNHYLKKTKRKRRNIIHRSKKSMGNSVNNGAAIMRDKSFVQGTLKSGRDGYNESSTAGNESASEHHDKKISDNLQSEGSKLEVNEQVELEHGEVEEDSGWKQAEKTAEDSKESLQGTVLIKHDQNQLAKDLSQDRNTTSYLKVEKRQITNDTSITSELEHISLKDTPANTTIHIQEETSFDDKEQDKPDPKQLEKQATRLQQLEERIDAHKEDEVSKQAETVDDEEPENPGMEDIKRQSESDASRESTSNSDSDEELNSDGSNKPEFQ